ncbi:MAG: helix-turn-helix transcriptional regulator [Defluviitaleaceae bacterium]|nr:helix-turn-helix transcriptional regulator [Defluviitaleaceae bacterium]
MKKERTAAKSSDKYTPFGCEVKYLIAKKGMTLVQLSKATGTPKGYISLIIRGERRESKYIPIIAEYLGIDIKKCAG